MHEPRDLGDGLDAGRRELLAKLSGRYVRSAKVVGDEAAYETLMAMAQDFRTRYPLVDGDGNTGSIDGDPPADAEYTRVRLAPLARELPRFPNLLVNGSATIPPHNLREAVAAVLASLDEPEIDVPGLMAHLPGPDFPSGGVIVDDGADLRAIYETGHGTLRVRARAHFEGQTIVVTELPYGVEKGGDAGVIREIVDLMVDRRVRELHDLQDHTNRRGQRLLLTVRDDAEPQAVLDTLLAQTSLETTFAVDIVALVDGAPVQLSLPELLRGFVAGRDPATVRAELQDIAERFGDDRGTLVGRP